METGPEDINPNEHIIKSTWLRITHLYMRTPVLKDISPIMLLPFILVPILIHFFPPGHCTCEDQIDDPKLKQLAIAGDTNVRRYQQQIDDIYICAAKRAELLKKLELQKKRQQDSLKSKTPKT